MALYEILIRGNPDGTLSGAHIKNWIAAGTNVDGSPRYVPSDPAPIAADAIATYTGQQFAEVAAQATQRSDEATERDALQAEIDALKAQVVALRGTPVFRAEALIAQLTIEEKAQITQYVSGNPDLLALWSSFLDRVAGREMPLDSATVQAGIAGLQQVLGEARVAALFAALGIDLATGRYIQA